MKRKIYDELLKWKERNGDCALLIEGARRVGKSYIAEEFAKNEYKSYILIDFNKVNKKILDLFDNYLDDLDTFFLFLAQYYNKILYERNTLIIFDEIQLYPRARSAIKYLVEDGRYDYLETGSLMFIKMNVENILIPSEEHKITMYPLDFEEFLWALGDETTIPLIRHCFNKLIPLEEANHRKIMTIFRKYLLIGGMPQAVNEFVKSSNFNKVDDIKRDILNLYRNDIVKFARGYEIKVINIFDEIPSQLQKHERKFKLSSLNKNARFRNYEDAFLWLNDAMIVNICYNTCEPNLGFKMNTKRTALKCYMGDTGLLLSHTFDINTINKEELYTKILFDKLEFNNGMFLENMVSQMLTANGHKLYFYSNPSNIDTSKKMEIDFLIPKSKITTRHNIDIFEVKSGKNYTLTSLNKYINKYNNELHQAYVIHTSNLNVRNNIIYLPVYMTILL